MEAAAQVGAVVRRALATEVRQKEGRSGPVFQAQCGGFVGHFTGVRRAQQIGDPLQGARGRQHHAHLVPLAWQRMAKSMGGAGGIGLVAGGDHKQHAAGAQRQKALPRLHRAHAHGAGRVVPRATGHHDARGQAQLGRHLGQQVTTGLAALHQARHLVARHAGQGQQRVGPLALAHIQPQRAAGVRHVGHMLAGQHQAHIVFGQQHLGHLPKNGGLMFGHPAQLGRGEPGHGQAAAEVGQLGHFGHHLGAFGGAARVVPQNGRSQNLVVRVQQHRAVHLARQANALHGRHLCGVRQAQLRQRFARSRPPVLRRLFAVAGVRARNGERAARHRHHPVVAGQKQNLDLRSANVDT